MIKFDFNKVEVKNIDETLVDGVLVGQFRQQIANSIYSQSRTIEEFELAKKVYHADGEVELTEKEVEIWNKALDGFVVPIRLGFTIKP